MKTSHPVAAGIPADTGSEYPPVKASMRAKLVQAYLTLLGRQAIGVCSPLREHIGAGIEAGNYNLAAPYFEGSSRSRERHSYPDIHIAKRFQNVSNGLHRAVTPTGSSYVVSRRKSVLSSGNADAACSSDTARIERQSVVVNSHRRRIAAADCVRTFDLKYVVGIGPDVFLEDRHDLPFFEWTNNQFFRVP